MKTDNIHSNVMLVELRMSQWTARKMDRKGSQLVAAQNQVDENVGRYYKSLLDPAILRDIKSLVDATRKEYYKRTLPWSDDGPRILTAEVYFEFMETMGKYREQFDAMTSKFLQDYPYHREEAKRFLGGLFKDTDYPEPEELAKKFGFHLIVRPLPHSADFRCNIGAEEIEKVKQQIEEQTRETLQNSVRAAFDRVMEVAARYADRLADPENVFRDSMVESARELVEIMPKMNFTNDPELDRLTEVVRDKLAAHDPQTLRTNMGARKAAADAAKTVVSDIETFFGGSNQ